MIPLPIFHNMHPLVNPRRQTLFAAENFENGEVVGKAYYLFTHGKFCKKFLNITPIASDYVFSLVTGNDTFAIDSSTGIITISNITNFTLTTIITVRCTFQGTYFEDHEIEIIRTTIAESVYIDYTFVGTSTGTRAAPYIRIRNYPIEDRYGKTFYYKSGTETLDEYLTIANDPADPWTNISRWGTGDRPEVDLRTNTESNRFMKVGTSSTVGGFKIRVREIDFQHDKSTNIYFFQIRAPSRNIQVSNCSFNGTTQQQGFIWCPQDGVPDVFQEKNRIFSNLEFSDFTAQETSPGVFSGCRCVKFEHGGNIFENGKAVSTYTGFNSATVSAVDHRFTEISWLYSDTTTANNNLGPNIRRSEQQYRNCYIKGPNNGLVVINNTSETTAITSSSFFKNCIVEDCSQRGILFSGTQSFEVGAGNTLGIQGIVTKNCGVGIDFAGDVTNINAVSCIFENSVTNGVRHGSGSSNKIINSVSLGSGGSDINVSAGSLAVSNSIFVTSTGTLVQETNSAIVDQFEGFYKPISGSDLNGAGTFIAGTKDILGIDFLNPPSIGAYEFTPLPPTAYLIVRKKIFV